MFNEENNKENSSRGLPSKLFLLWIFLLPFHGIPIVGSLALDSMLAPLVILLSLVSRYPSAIDGYQYIGRVRNLRVICFYIIVYVSCFIPSIFQSDELLWVRAWDLLISIGYFILPILYIRDIVFLRKVNSLIIMLTIIGCVSVFLVSVGVLELSYTRFEDSRIGLSWLPKSVGLFSNYGDLALLIAYTLLLTFWVEKDKYFFGYGSKKVKTIILLIMLAGLLGSQSRNVLLTSLVAIAAYYLVVKMYTSGRSRNSYGGIVLLFFIFISTIIAIVFWGSIVAWISSLGGQNAAQTANTRLDTYVVAWNLLKASPLFGLDYKTYIANAALIDGLHNMWLGLALHGGMIVVLAFILMYINIFFKTVWRISHSVIGNEAAISAAFLISILVAVSFYVADRSVVFWFLLGLASSVHCLSYTVKKDAKTSLLNKSNLLSHR